MEKYISLKMSIILKQMNSKLIPNTIFLFALTAITLACNTSRKIVSDRANLDKDSINCTFIKTDSLFDSKQSISIISLDKSSLDRYSIKIGCSDETLEKTSKIAIKDTAIAAINGSFFDVDRGGSVTYLEINDLVISRTRSSELKWGKPDSLISGAIIMTKTNKLKIEPAKTDAYYLKSKKEVFAIVAGPLLLSNSILQKLPNMEFVHQANPRTCLCNTKDSVLFITIDGRTEKAEGMSLIEAQIFLKDIGCVDAINLDGGGSTTMWMKNKGIINSTSDKEGERPVANAILIVKNK